jgi:hypothetical protein
VHVEISPAIPKRWPSKQRAAAVQIEQFGMQFFVARTHSSAYSLS